MIFWGLMEHPKIEEPFFLFPLEDPLLFGGADVGLPAACGPALRAELAEAPQPRPGGGEPGPGDRVGLRGVGSPGFAWGGSPQFG